MIRALTGIANKSNSAKTAAGNTCSGGHKQTRLSEDYSTVAGVMAPMGFSRENFQMITFRFQYWKKKKTTRADVERQRRPFLLDGALDLKVPLKT